MGCSIGKRIKHWDRHSQVVAEGRLGERHHDTWIWWLHLVGLSVLLGTFASVRPAEDLAGRSGPRREGKSMSGQGSDGGRTANTDESERIAIAVIQSPFWTADEAASYCRVSINTMQQLLRIGEIPARRVGRQWRILKNDLDEYLGVGQRGRAERKGR